MTCDDSQRWDEAFPCQASAPDAAARPAPDPTPTHVLRDGGRWPVGTAAAVAWIGAGTVVGNTIDSAVPPLFDAYATIVLPRDRADQSAHDAAILSVLRAHSGRQPWWLGYLDTGADDVVFPEAPRVQIYAHWSYVLVQAGPDQAATWRRGDLCSFWSGQLPNLMFPADRSWLVTTLWDDDWTCIGGSALLVGELLHHPQLRSRARSVEVGQDATPPGHQAF